MIYNKNVYILGAGFSRHAGAPLMADFISHIINIWSNPGSPIDSAEREQYAGFLGYRSNLASVRTKINIDLNNIEELLGLAEMDVDWGGYEDTRLKNNYLYALLRTLELTTEGYDLERFEDFGNQNVYNPNQMIQNLRRNGYTYTKPGKAGTVNSIYQLFGYLIKKSKENDGRLADSIITFNYDLLLEKALLEIGLKIDYSLPPVLPYTLPPLNVTNYLSNSKYQGKNSVFVLKLHGSANWILCRKCNHIYILPPHVEELSALGDGRNKLLADGSDATSHIKNIVKMTCLNCKERGSLFPLIAPPTWNKFKDQQLFGIVWEKALKEIREAHRIIVIGYSLPETDTFFKYLITLGCHVPFDQEIIVINRSGKTKDKYEKFVDPYYRNTNFQFHTMEFGPKIFEGELTLDKIVYRPLW